MNKIGIFGGTFNPIHNGHIMLAQYCKEQLGLDKVIIIPTFTPPHKSSKDLAGVEHRLNMCKLAVINLSDYEVSDIEVLRKGKSYTYQTLTALKELYPDDIFYLITGADMFLTINKWKNPEVIFKNAVIVAVPRDMSDRESLQNFYSSVLKDMGARAEILPNAVVQVSSTFIRENIDNENIVRPLIDRNVYEYILKNNLYRM